MQTKNAARAYPRQAQRITGGDSTESVGCRICGKHLRVISGRHLCTHGTDRETYMQEYRLSPDKLCSKAFRVNHSSRRDYRPYNKREWIAELKKFYKQHGHVYAGFLQQHYLNLYRAGIWLFGNWDAALRAAGFTPENMRLWAYWNDERVITEIQVLREKSVPLHPAYALRHYNGLFSAARRIFGPWRTALVAAGLEILATSRRNTVPEGYVLMIRVTTGTSWKQPS